MKKWIGAAGICMNAQNELLMVREETRDGASAWTVPSGGVEPRETNEQCIVRETAEETGYLVEILEKLKVKRGKYENLNITYEVHYFSMKIIAGQPKIQDPDNLVLEIAWKPLKELKSLPLSYPEDREFLDSHLKQLINK